MAVIEIIAHLGAPVILREELHADGLLMSAHPQCRQAPCSAATPEADLVRAPIPIAAITGGGVTVACGTVALLPDTARPHETHTVKRRDALDVEALARPIHLGLGPGKNRLVRWPAVTTPTLRWIVIGFRRPIVRMLKRIVAVGAMRSAGYGIVSRWEAIRRDDLTGLAAVHDGDRALRHLPAWWVTDAEVVLTGAVEPPYWHPARQTVAMVPAGTRCVLRPEYVRAIHATALRPPRGLAV